MKKSLGKIFGRKTKKRGSSFDLADGTSTPFTPQDLSQDAARSRSKSLFGGTLFKVPLFAAQADDGSLSGLDEKEPEKKEGVPISEKKKTRSTVPVEREAAKVKFPDDMAESSSAAKRNSEAVEESNPGSVRKDEAAVQSESPAAERIDTDELLKVENLKDAHKHLTPAIMLPVVLSYEQIPLLEQTKLPRGGVSIDTKAVGRVQVRKRLIWKTTKHGSGRSCLKTSLIVFSVFSLVFLLKPLRIVCD